ncbi:MAG: CRISPR-associated helicase Cas3' [Methanothrix sp.]|uniref:type I-G CRISPR-associated helicase/endonuclease Cas3g n=1 Tax=Methanothrix sp. TaxID=90426 RepID=UPI0025F00163|nr:CRISPR-associated helicase Cas3' [Methanothrix sp.]MCQ8903233.1 CRISPR-associated helicase Cas3' [Methanothrix sp.]
MMKSEFHNFFEAATGYPPYPYQERLATDEQFPHIIKIPTGMGKTDAVILSWLWRRRFDTRLNVRSTTPRRLVYCLPMRVLVEQVKERAEKWLKNLGILASNPGDGSPLDGWSQDHDGKDKRIAVTVLMGGEDANEWDLYPERDCILIGTQDMLLSRALNRGYGMSRYRWPMHFGLLNNDCLWVMDEVQLMGPGFTTSVQLHAFRDIFGTIWPSSTHTIWMSATIEREWLSTVDLRSNGGALRGFSLNSNDLDIPSVKRRMNALKVLKKANSTAEETQGLVREVLEKHVRGTRTIVILNTVKRAVNLYHVLTKKSNDFRVLLIHSQFRPLDRKKVLQELMKNPDDSGTIVISTQVVEAGVDVSARTMFTELAPWSSLIQRFGRCNRSGEYDEAEIYWIDLPESKKRNEFALPYSIEDLDKSREILKSLDGKNVGPGLLPQIQLQFMHKKILRRKDLVELFDTTPDLAATDIDISRFIRETTDTDVQVFWRDVEDAKEEMFPQRDELCPVPLADIRELIKNGGIAWYWDQLEGSWTEIRDPMQIIPGMIILLRASDGRYSPTVGWEPQSKTPVQVVPLEIKKRPEGYEDNPTSTGEWQTIAEHTEKVVQIANRVLEALGIEGMWRDTLLEVSRWHDCGKAHPSFQAMLKTDASEIRAVKFPVAKAPEDAWLKGRLPDRPRKNDLRRRHFRHELASAILALMNGKSDLVSYLVAAHHGKVRMSIRSMPGEYRPPDGGRFARGVWEGDTVPAVDLGGGVRVAATPIDLSYMDLGDGPSGPSWLSRSIALRDDPDIGPFRLSYLEALIKAFDERASRGEI